MNTNNVFRKRPGMFLSLLLGVSVLALPACEDDEENAPEEKVTVQASATLDAEQETEDVTSEGTGTFQGTYNKNTGEFTFTLNWSNLTGPPTMMHFHGPANVGANASVKIGITGFPSSATGSVNGTVTVEEGDRADLLAGKWYANIHTEAYPAGEIRGQVTFPNSGNNGDGGDNGGGGYEY